MRQRAREREIERYGEREREERQREERDRFEIGHISEYYNQFGVSMICE